ncbi:flagellar biosynthetic protein FliO [Anoxybacter fermentans]|uniref:flagellar biosynthetic protein FliO n=1 Tax=Anoxybacter fermentans TaxID=1323375 RepID=UPI000F8E92E7|nr:flagellar biosynthetic protein FliO [Anoxybacter fermentans]
MSQHAQVYIVKVADKYYLLGLTEDKITLLDTFDELRVSKEEVVADLSNSIFMEIFKKTLKKRDGSDE